MWRLKSLTSEIVAQRVYYSQGVGTKRGEVARGGVEGYGIDDEIIEAHTWLIQYFDDGEIFIFPSSWQRQFIRRKMVRSTSPT